MSAKVYPSQNCCDSYSYRWVGNSFRQDAHFEVFSSENTKKENLPKLPWNCHETTAKPSYRWVGNSFRQDAHFEVFSSENTKKENLPKLPWNYCQTKLQVSREQFPARRAFWSFQLRKQKKTKLAELPWNYCQTKLQVSREQFPARRAFWSFQLRKNPKRKTCRNFRRPQSDIKKINIIAYYSLSCHGVVGVVISHPLSMREALGSIPRAAVVTSRGCSQTGAHAGTGGWGCLTPRGKDSEPLPARRAFWSFQLRACRNPKLLPHLVTGEYQPDTKQDPWTLHEQFRRDARFEVFSRKHQKWKLSETALNFCQT